MKMEKYFWPAAYEHQNEARALACEELSHADRCQVLMACGTGKTRVGPEIALELDARTVVVYVPSLALMRQTLPAWMSAPFRGGMSYLCVCSDQTVADEDETILLTEELIHELHLSSRAVTTRIEDVREFLSLPGFDGVRVLFSTYQSSDVVSEGCPDGFSFDLGIFDEAHRTAGSENAFSGPLADSHTPIAKRVFMTATPKHFDYRRRKKDGDPKTIFSMDNERFFGRVAYRLPIRRAIERGLIAGYKVLISVVDDRMIKMELDLKPGTFERNEIELLAHAVAIRNAMETFGVKKIVTFHDTVEEAKLFLENPKVRKEIGAELYHVNGMMPTSVRSMFLDRFASAPSGLVTNSRCLTEGVDVPDIDMVAFLHPRKSHVDIIQAIGRALRLGEDGTKDTGYILLPLYVSNLEGDGLDDALRKTGYEQIWQIIEALREQDEVVEASIRDAVLKPNDPSNLGFMHVIGAHWLNLDRLRATISLRCIEVLGEFWDKNFAILQRLHDQGEDVNVFQRAVIDGVNIGIWVSNQRSIYKDGKLSQDRIARLEAIGFKWNKFDSQWGKAFAILRRLYDQGEDVNVSIDMVIDGVKVGIWASHQRNNYKSGKLLLERIARLEAIGFKWKDTLDSQWEMTFAILRRLYDQGEDVNVSWKAVIDGVNIGIWVSKQRSIYKDGKLSQDRIARLEAIGFKWGRLNHKWEESLAILRRLYDQGKDVNLSRDIIDGVNIGMWAQRQRIGYKSGKLSQDCIARLEAIGFKWEIFDSQWQERFAILQRLHDQGEDVNVFKRAVIDGVNIGQWASGQRRNYKSGKLPQERIARLEAIGFKWKIKS